MNPDKSVVCVVDDDAAVRRSLCLLVKAPEVEVWPYPSAREYLHDPRREECDCLLLDLRMPGMGGLELQSRLADEEWTPPIIFITGHADVSVAVQAMRAGATDFLQKPFDHQILLDRVNAVLERGATLREQRRRRRELQGRLDSLSKREHQVLERIMAGRMNKVIAGELSISMKTVEDHRASIMRKARARSMAELVQIVLEGRRQIRLWE